MQKNNKKDIIGGQMRIGEVSAINKEKGLVQVVYDDIDVVTGWLNCLESGWPVYVGDIVAVVHKDGYEEGVCLGRIVSYKGDKYGI